MSESSRIYDRYHRDPEARKFYNGARWKRAAAKKRQLSPLCERCDRQTVEIVHHTIPLEQCTTDEQRYDPRFLRSFCRSCHNSEHGELNRAKDETAFVSGQRTLIEDEHFRYDAHKATAVERFAAKFCRHWRGSLKGQPFILHPLQCGWLREPYGMVDRLTERRLINSIWIETAIGTGKTPVMSITGLEHLIGGSEPGAQIYSMSNTFGQANHMFEAAKTFIKNGPLEKLVDKGSLVVKQYEIYYRPTESRWQITSGKGSKAGGAASLILADEIHQIESRELYDDLQGRQEKREQPLIICATNAAKRPRSLYADLHEEAVDTLTDGSRFNRRLFPIIWAAPKEADPASPASWRLANRLLGVTIDEKAVQDVWKRAAGSPVLTARFRLQYLGQQVTDVERWLDMDEWDAATARPMPDDETLAKLPRYSGIDLSRGDDLCAVLDVRISPDHIYVLPRFYLPRQTADEYEASHELPFTEWAASGAMTLLDETTISAAVQERIADDVIAAHKAAKITKVCYDRAYSEQCIEKIKAANIPSEKIGQGWGISDGCNELRNRLKAGTITIASNPVLRWNAENAVVKSDDRGNIWPIKPGAKGTYAGTRSAKIDGITALATALTEARKHNFPKATTVVRSWLI